MTEQKKPTHPGLLIRKNVIDPLGLTVTEAAEYLGVTRKTLSALLNGKAMLSPEMAIRIGTATKTSPASWYLGQAKLDLWYAMQKGIEKEVSEFDNLEELGKDII